MNPEEYAEKHASYMKSEVALATTKWAVAYDLAGRLRRKLAEAEKRQEALWTVLKEVEAAHPDEVNLAKEISAERARRFDESKQARPAV